MIVEISRFVDEDPPGFVECTLIDAQGNRHAFVEKLPVVTCANLWAASRYPQPGVIRCRIEARWQDERGRAVVQVSTELPDHVESTSGQSSFVVLTAQVRE